MTGGHYLPPQDTGKMQISNFPCRIYPTGKPLFWETAKDLRLTGSVLPRMVVFFPGIILLIVKTKVLTITDNLGMHIIYLYISVPEAIASSQALT